jgi:hypothetical protein
VTRRRIGAAPPGRGAACDTPGRMNLEYVWWIFALILTGVGVVAFLAFGRVPEIEDELESSGAPPDPAAPGAEEPDSP